MIPFLIPVGIFLFFDTIDKTQTDTYLVVFNLGTQLKKLGPMHTLCHSFHISL
jgi:hypothetical protein